jgi:Phosphotransferase enzyme family
VSLDQRPDAPSPTLLDQARASLASRLLLNAGSLRWRPGRRVDRKRSTLFPLTLVSGSSPVATAWYKKVYFPGEKQSSKNLPRARAAILSSEAMGAAFQERAEPSAIHTNITLSLEPETLEVITLGLEGPPLGNPIRHYVTRPRRETALRTCADVGRAVAILEKMGDGDPKPGLERVWHETERKLVSVSPMITDKEFKALEASLSSLFEEAISEPAGITLAHGDLGPGNVIVMSSGTGIIDFMWVPQLRGFDLSRFVHRLRYTTPSYQPWITALTEATVEGYGDPHAASRPGWRFSELQRLLATVQLLDKKGEGGRRAVGRALDEIRAGIGSTEGGLTA